jgi:Domain of unknown function (DUF4301)
MPEPEELFTAADLRQMAALGIAPEEAARQVGLFRNPPPFTRVLRPCTVGDGIRQLFPSDHAELLDAFKAAAAQGRIGKFVPASGAATRMFKDLLAYLHSDLHDGGAEMPVPVRTFFDNLSRFAFYDDLCELCGLDEDAAAPGDPRTLLRALLLEPGLGYAEKPKGLIKFHREGVETRTAFEEHLVEAVPTVRDSSGLCRLHFTVSPQHEEGFVRLLEQVRPRYEERFGCEYDVGFSHQSRATDTLAVDPENRPFRQDDGTLLYRPGGHGSLIGNLESLARAGWDIVLIKNVDNVVPDSRKGVGLLWKKLLAGALVSLQKRIFHHLERLEAGPASLELLDEIDKFLADDLLRPVPPQDALAGSESRRRMLIHLLDRPLRVCGVVRNQGEPGGGPFWVESPDGETSLQIVETSQIDPESPEQQAILKSSTHFNPADLACALRDRHGRPYDLKRFIDPATVFISSKSHEGRPLKALERPGLWNGAMAGWNTVFVEVPDETFAPVKTVLDLLRPEHQG